MTCQYCTQAYLEPSGEENCCKGCKEHGSCEDCGEKPAGSDISMFRCDDCAAKWLDNYEPPEEEYPGPTLQERQAHEATERSRDRFR